ARPAQSIRRVHTLSSLHMTARMISVLSALGHSRLSRALLATNRCPLRSDSPRFCAEAANDGPQPDLVFMKMYGELDGCVLSNRQPLRAGSAERTLATSCTILRTSGGSRPCDGSSKLRSRNAQSKPPP